MALKIRLRKQGRTNRPFYRIVVTDGRNKRDGRYVESIGWYNPVEAEAEKNLFLNGERVRHWLEQGAVLSENTEQLVARAAPEVIQWKKEKEIALRAKMATKRRTRKKA